MGVKTFVKLLAALNLFLALSTHAAEVTWTHLSSANGQLPAPSTSTQQTGALVADLDNDGINDFVLGFRQAGPALVWYRRITNGWDRLVIDPDYLTVEAGGVALDIDNDGDLDVVFGGDWQSKEVWWWENPYPNFDAKKPWNRRFIKNEGATQHHDQLVGDFKGSGAMQLVFWNQGAKKLFITDVPHDPRSSPKWEYREIFSGTAGEGTGKYAEGLMAADVDKDGKIDILAGNFWLKHMGGNQFNATKIGEIGGRIAVGHFKAGTYSHVVIAPGDSVGPLRWYESKGDPLVTEHWVGHDLLNRDMVHGHTLAIGDIDADGNDDIFAAEMAKWTENRPDSDNPNAEAWIFYGDGKGNFRKTVLAKGIGFHEGRLADLDGDGDLDILDKPYNWEAPRVDVWLNNGTSTNRPSIFKGPIGLQLFSVRRQMAKSVHEAFLQVKAMGFNEVEGGGAKGMTMAQFRHELEDTGLRCTSMMAGYERLGNDMTGVIRDAKLLGSTYVNCSWIPHKGNFTRDDAIRAVADFNAWGKALKSQGIQFCYHPHGFEFQPSPEGTLFDYMVQQTDPETVGFEMDVFWVVHPGQDPVKLMRQYPNRFFLMHLKDMRIGTTTGILTGQAPEDTNVPIGSGQIDYRAVLREAQRIGIKKYFIEDESADPLRQIPVSLKWLKEVKL